MIGAGRPHASSSRRVLITGVSGFIGRDLMLRLARAGWQVRAAARNRARVATGPNIEPVELPDMAGEIDWRPLVDGVSHVVHLAGIAHATASIPEETYNAVNAQAVQSLALAARQARVGRVVLMSSIRAQCGPWATGIVMEDRPPAPTDAYGRSKLEGERLLAAALSDGTTDWCTLRPVVVYGSGVKGNVATLLRLARTPWPLPLGALAARRSLLGLDNLGRAVVHVLTADAASRATFVLADPEPLMVSEIVAAMRSGFGCAPRIWSLPLGAVRVAATLASRRSAWERISGDLVVATTNLQASGWQPSETAREGIARWIKEEATARSSM